MDNSLIIEGYILWADILSQSDQLSQVSSKIQQASEHTNPVLLAYAALCFINKKGRYIAAFILCEVFGNTYIYKSSGGWEIFFGYATVYSVLYWSCRDKLKLSMACATMVIFETVMVLDAKFYSDVETVLYVNYEYIVTAIHICIISSLLPWQRIKRGLVDIARAIYGVFSNGNSVAYIGYSYNTFKTKASERWKATVIY